MDDLIGFMVSLIIIVLIIWGIVATNDNKTAKFIENGYCQLYVTSEDDVTESIKLCNICSVKWIGRVFRSNPFRVR